MKISEKSLVDLLRWAADRVEGGDSFQGRIEWDFMAEDGQTEPDVTGAIRFGNSEGQGSMRLIEPSDNAPSVE